MIHTSITHNCTVFLLRFSLHGFTVFLARFSFYANKHGWPFMGVKNFKANLCGSLYYTFKTSFQPCAFYKKWLQTLFIELVQSKATCSFKTSCAFPQPFQINSSHMWCIHHAAKPQTAILLQ